MSRDGFSYDPRDTRDVAPRRALRPRRATSSEATSGRNPQSPALERSATNEARDRHSPNDNRGGSARAYYVRDRAHMLRGSELHSLRETGKFRVIATSDLATYAYHGDRDTMEKDIRHLRREGLLTEKTLPISQKKTLSVVTLTKAGQRLLKRTNQLPDDQAIYHGLRKPREAKHDADLYRLYQKEAARIERAGGTPLRVVLDYELKSNLNRDLALLGADRENQERKNDIAGKHGLQVVNGKIPVPDLRIEYETAEHEIRRVDLELATREYRPRALAEKAAAGFSLYSQPQDAARLRRILDERELTSGILTQ